MKHVLFWVGLIGLIVLHHDWWLWDDGRLLFGFLPVGLAYHALLSLAAGGFWAWAVLRGWPELFDEASSETDPQPLTQKSG